ncbi:MAG TPA: SDR family NAD(P)-dependent oxidoreductase, partial [Leptospiraceae bacterium]|nr:SDR family NAD(P)-dependent oxidoreductase [Leptospiraceae bacterium]
LLTNINFKFYKADVQNINEIQTAMKDFSDRIEMIFAVAGFYASRRDQIINLDEINQMIQVNFFGTYNTFLSGRDVMLAARGGHLVAISSMTALLYYPKATVYSATKRGVLNICEIFRNGYRDHNIRVTEVIPGYIDTKRLQFLNSQNPSPRPFILSVEEAATKIINELETGKERIIFPWQMYLLVRLISILPLFLQKTILGIKN